ncbi:MAG TPA: hypothetical protein EYP30_00245 [Archaeoglobaceae archaeon]|nr:hypothetical protein [Archaeoglobaceae archaeon]
MLGILSIFNTPEARFLFLLLPAGVIGFFILPNITIFLIEEPPFTVNLTEAGLAEGEHPSCQSCHPEVATEIMNTPHHTNFECEVCHTGMSRNVSCDNCHYVIGFAAHRGFVEWSVNNSAMYSSNEACIACHTHAKIELYELQHIRELKFFADARMTHN